jgi:hypothetical protein
MNDSNDRTRAETACWRFLALWIWLPIYAIAAAIGGYWGDDFLSWSNLLWLGVGVVATTISVAVSWLRFPVRNEDGSLHLRSLLEVACTFGVFTGVFVGSTYWLVALVASEFAAQLLRDWSAMARASISAILGAAFAGFIGWSMRKPKE